MRILVTGASGFIGHHTVERLTRSGHSVVASGRDHLRLQPLASTAAQLALVDLARDSLHALVQDCDAIVHCAALSAPWGAESTFHTANVAVTQRLLAAASNAGVKRFIHLGSPSIYFRFSDQYDVPEEFEPPQHWINAYARSKWESELEVRAAAAANTDLETVILRPRAVFGEGDRAILPRVLALAQRGWFPLIAGGDALIDITHVDNVCHAIEQSLHSDSANGRAYNITNGEPILVRDLLNLLFSTLGMRVRRLPLPRAAALALAGVSETVARLRRGQPEPRLTRYGVGVIGYSQTLNIAAARRDLDYRPEIGIEAGLHRFARHWNAHASA